MNAAAAVRKFGKETNPTHIEATLGEFGAAKQKSFHVALTGRQNVSVDPYAPYEGFISTDSPLEGTDPTTVTLPKDLLLASADYVVPENKKLFLMLSVPLSAHVECVQFHGATSSVPLRWHPVDERQIKPPDEHLIHRNDQYKTFPSSSRPHSAAESHQLQVYYTGAVPKSSSSSSQSEILSLGIASFIVTLKVQDQGEAFVEKKCSLKFHLTRKAEIDRIVRSHWPKPSPPKYAGLLTASPEDFRRGYRFPSHTPSEAS